MKRKVTDNRDPFHAAWIKVAGLGRWIGPLDRFRFIDSAEIPVVGRRVRIVKKGNRYVYVCEKKDRKDRQRN